MGKHRRRMGPAIWEFCWLISHETRNDGKVFNGEPISVERIARELDEHVNTAQANLIRLCQQGYVLRNRVGAGEKYSYCIQNAKKWKLAGSQNSTLLPQKTVAPPPPLPQKTVAPPTENCGTPPTENCGANKERDKILEPPPIIPPHPWAKLNCKCKKHPYAALTVWGECGECYGLRTEYLGGCQAA